MIATAFLVALSAASAAAAGWQHVLARATADLHMVPLQQQAVDCTMTQNAALSESRWRAASARHADPKMKKKKEKEKEKEKERKKEKNGISAHEADRAARSAMGH